MRSVVWCAGVMVGGVTVERVRRGCWWEGPQRYRHLLTIGWIGRAANSQHVHVRLGTSPPRLKVNVKNHAFRLKVKGVFTCMV